MMGNILVPPSIQYLVRQDGQRTGVVLEWEHYQALQSMLSPDPDMLIGLSQAELQTLAGGMLSSHHQERLNELLQRNREEELSADEKQQLDYMLEQADYMNILKARAMYTLQRQSEQQATS